MCEGAAAHARSSENIFVFDHPAFWLDSLNPALAKPAPAACGVTRTPEERLRGVMSNMLAWVHHFKI
jgi:hypothetical protein